ncbi:protein mroh8 [Limosa lapponica baueri]|uniref:Protein mroh8 n=1 Tax=Limosa lapponica baueri TaxID=1758121 RepID=A0A2I0TJF4_LIMLA|nr:protein mroh8 [Limosa lapponica baueri]
MAERPPSRPRVAWEKVVTPRERRPPLEPYEVTMVQPLQTDNEWLCVYREEQETVDFIQAFVSSPEENEDQKIEFLDSICMLCRTANRHVLSQGLDAFCYTYDLAENIKVLLQKEPRDQLSTEVRWKAMLAIARLSSVESVPEGKEESLLEACFSRVFFLPPRAEMRGLTLELYIWTLDAMDNMLETLVLNCSVPRVTELVQNIFQMLLNFTNSETVVARVRALETIRTLSNLLAKNPSLEAWDRFGRDMYGPVCYGDLQIPILGQLLGRLLLFYSSKEETSFPAHDALLALSRLIHNQKSRSAAKGKAQELHWKPDRPSILYQPTTRDFVMEFAEHLRCWEITDVVLAAIEAMRDSSIFDKEAARSVLDLFMRYPSSWLADVPKIMSCIHENLEHINMESARQSVASLLRTLTDQDPTKVVLNLLKLSPPGDRILQDIPEEQGPSSHQTSPIHNGTAMWEVMLSIPQTLEKIFEELLRQIRRRKSHSLVESTIENAYITHLALMASTEFQSEDCGNTYQRHSSLMTASLLLRRLIPLSERPDMTSRS